MRLDDRVRIKYDYAGSTGTVTDVGVLGAVVQWDAVRYGVDYLIRKYKPNFAKE